MTNRCLMAVHAHPDDEVFSTGGILAKSAQQGDRVVVVYCTNGEAGEMHDADLVPEEAIPRLGEIRMEEARKACALLGVTDVVFLGYRDSGMKDTEENAHPAAFTNAALDEAAQRLIDDHPIDPAAGHGRVRRGWWIRPSRPHHGAPHRGGSVPTTTG